MSKVRNQLSKVNTEDLIKIVYFIFFGVGVLGLSYNNTRDLFITLMPFSLLLSMGLMFWMHDKWHLKHVTIFILIILIGFFVEVAGVLTGVVFGEYSYGHALGFKIWGTPPMIGLNWLMLIYAVYQIINLWKIPIFIRVLGGSALMVIYDIIMEPVAVKLNMWSWGGGSIPLQNYVAWFIISVVFLSVMQLTKVKTGNQVAVFLVAVQTGFFLALNLVV